MALADLFTRTKKKINDYFAPAPQVRTRDFVREAPQAIKTTFNDIRTGGLAGLGKRISSTMETGEYFKPVPMQKPSVKNLGTGIRLRDFVRELPTGIGETGNKVAQDAARFAISAYETPGTMKNKKATGKFYDTPLGRLNSYQSEAENRVKRGDPLWKAIGNPAAEAVLFGAPDVTAIGKSVVKSPIVKAVGKRVLGKTLNNEAKDIVADAGLKVARLARPHIFGKTGSPYRSKLMRSLSRPGLTIEDVSIKPRDFNSAEDFAAAHGETLYHGTPAKFDTKDFKGGYLTGDKRYADNYRGRSASSISYGNDGVKNKASGVPRTLEFILGSDANLFDYKNPKHRALLKEYWGVSSMSGEPNVGKSGQLDWTEGENLREFFQEKGIKFDGIKLDEAGGIDPESRLEVKRAPSILVMNPKVLKDKKSLIEAWNSEHGVDNRLLSVHNLTERKLRFADRVGGLSNPSLAVIDPEKTAFESFGDITLVPRKNILRGEKTHLADAYSPRFPSVHTSMPWDKFKKLETEMEPFFKKTDGIRLTSNTDDLLGSMYNNDSMQLRFLESKGIQPEGDNYYRILGQIEKAGLESEYDAFVRSVFNNFGGEEKIFAGYTSSGKRRYKPLSVEEASRLMSKEKEEGFNYGLGSYRSKIAPVKRSPEDIRKNEKLLVSTEEFEKVKKEYDDEFFALSGELAPFSTTERGSDFMNSDATMNYLGSLISNDRWAWNNFRNMYKDVPPELMSKIYAFQKKLKKMPTEYFETKLKRPVGLSEFEHAIVPEKVSPEVLALLEKHGIRPIKYADGEKQKQMRSLLANDSVAFAGVPAGLEMDENGNVKVDPVKMAIGVGGMAIGRRVGASMLNDAFSPKMWAELNQIAGKAVRTPIDDARYADLESRFYKLSSDDQMQLLGMADVIDDVPMGGLGDEIGNQYDTFTNLFKNPKLRRPEVKNAIMDGDFETLKRELSARGVMSPTEVDNMLYDGEKSSDELLDMFKTQLRADNPELFMGKRIAANLGEVPWEETTVDKKFMSEADAFMEEAKSQAPFGGYLPSGAKDEPLMLPMGRDFTSKEAQRIFKKSGDVVPFKNVLKPAKPMVFGETGADFRRLGIDAKVPTEKVRVDYNYTDPEAPENLSMLRKWITSGEKILVKQGTAGKELAKRMQQQRKAEDLLRGSYVTDIKETLNKLPESERMMVTDILEGKEVPKAPQRVTEAAQKMRGFLDEVAEEAQVGGFEIRVPGGKTVPFAKRPNYYPRQYDFDELQRGAMHDRALQHLVETKQARNLAEAEKMLSDFIFANTERRSGNLENARMFDVPGYDRDPLTALQRYASGVAKRFTEAKYFGKKDEMSAALINKIAQNDGDYNEAQRIFDLQVEGLPKNDVVGAITKYNVATKLDLAFITNATQSINTITKAGLINTIMGAARGFTKKGRRFAEEVGAVQDSHIYEREVGKFNSIAKAVMIPFRIVENFNRRTAANTGLIRTKELYERAQGGSRYAIRELKNLGIDPTKKELTNQDLLGAAYEMTRKTQFKVDSLDIPPAWKTPLGRLVTQFKSFSFAQTKFVRDEILKEFVKGNPMPLLRFVPLAIGASMGSQYVRNMLTGRDPQDDTKNTDIRQWDKWLKGFGTIPTDLIIQGKFLKDTYDSEYLTAMRKLSRVLGSTLGVTAGTATSWMAAIESISSTEAKNKLLGVEKEKQDPYLDLKRQATGDIPIVGEYAKNKLFPYKKSDKTEEEKAQTKAYFDTKDRVMAGMTTKERAALDSLPTTNPLNPWAKIQKYTTYRTSPAVFEAKRQLALTAEKGDMEKIDPLFRYEYESVKPYLAYQSMLPNARERKALREKFPIIMQLGKERSDFFEANPIDPEFAQPDIKGLAPYPEVDAETEKLMNAKNWKHPKVQAYFDARDAWESQVYALAGVPLTQDGFGFGGGKGKKPPKPQYRELPFEDLEDFISKRNIDVSPKAQFGVGVPISKPSFSMPTRSQIATRKASLRKRKPITVSFRGRQAV